MYIIYIYIIVVVIIIINSNNNNQYIYIYVYIYMYNYIIWIKSLNIHRLMVMSQGPQPVLDRVLDEMTNFKMDYVHPSSCTFEG